MNVVLSSFLWLSATVDIANAFSTTINPAAATVTATATETATVVDNNFDELFADAPGEITKWKKLEIKGTIPPYLRGTLMRNGPALWTAGETEADRERLSHVFDGIAKCSLYRVISGRSEEEETKVEFQNRFIQSKYYQQVKREKKIPPMLYVGPVASLKTGQPRRVGWHYVLRAFLNAAKSDNACINIWDYDPEQRRRSTAATMTNNGGRRSVMAITDSLARAELSVRTGETLDTVAEAKQPIQGFAGYKMCESAHPSYSLTSEDTYNAVVGMTMSGPSVIIVKESPLGSREMVGKCAIGDGVPYVHSMEVTRNHAVVVLPPQRMNLNLKQMAELGFLQSFVHVDQTRVLVFNLETGECVMDQGTNEKVYFYHGISAIEYHNDDGELEISVRLCAYKAHDFLDHEDLFLRLDQGIGNTAEKSSLPPKSQFCDIICNPTRSMVHVRWNDLGQAFELPTTRYSRCYGANAETPSSRHPKYVYGVGSSAVFKFNPDEKKIEASFRRKSLYLTEPIFVANPDSRGCKDREDDGVVLVQGYDNIRRETALFVLDATNMKVLAELWTGQVTPHDIHGAWIPEE